MKHLIAVLCLALTGCAAPYNVKIDAYGSDAGTPRTFHIFEPEFLPRSELAHAEQYDNIERALVAVGFTKAPPDEARQLIVPTWGLGATETVAKLAYLPTIGMVPTGSTLSGTAVQQGQFTHMTATQTNQSQLGVTGIQPVQTFVNVTPITIVISSLDIARLPSDTPPLLWQIQINAQLQDTTPRAAMPQMLYTAAPYFGKTAATVMPVYPGPGTAQ